MLDHQWHIANRGTNQFIIPVTHVVAEYQLLQLPASHLVGVLEAMISTSPRAHVLSHLALS